MAEQRHSSWFRAHVVDSFTDAARCSWANARRAGRVGALLVGALALVLLAAVAGLSDGWVAILLRIVVLASLAWFAQRSSGGELAKPRLGWTQPGAILFSVLNVLIIFVVVATIMAPEFAR